jgi:hypothetical protein
MKLQNWMFTGVALLACLATKALAGPPAGQAPLAPSHALLYPSDDEPKPLLIYVVIQQPPTLRFVLCRNNPAVPRTPDQVTALLAGPGCSPDDGHIPGSSTSTAIQRVFHQTGSDRYLKLTTDILWDDGSSAGAADDMIGTTSAIFDPHQADFLTLLYTFVDHVDKATPAVSTVRATKLKAYESDVMYPVITERPIEQ